MGKALILLVLALTAACTTTPAPIADPRAVWCEHNEPRRPSAAVVAVMTRPDLDEMIAHNRQGVLWCGWRP